MAGSAPNVTNGRDCMRYKDSFQAEARVMNDVTESFPNYFKDCESITRMQREFWEQTERMEQQIQRQFNQYSAKAMGINLAPGLTPARIQKFHQSPADESIVGDRCSVCQDDFEVGRRMMRLDCDGQHVFCQGYVEGWFADHKTCPNCRPIFA